MNSGRILVVDDNEMNVELLQQELEDVGYDITVSYDGESCLEILSEQTFDCVVLDIMMPGMNGLDVLRHIRKTWSRTELPVIMATAKAQSTDVVEALKLGANDYVTKPIDAPILLARLEGLVDVRQSTPDPSPTRPITGLVMLDAAKSTAVEERNHHCPNCFYAVDQSATTCLECGSERGVDGWKKSTKYPLLGKWCGRYFFDRLVGRGFGGSVYRALDPDLDRFFAAKVIDLSETAVLSRDRLRDLAVSEVKTLAKLQNPHIVQIFELIACPDGSIAVIMQWVEGLNLSGALRKFGAMPPKLAIDIVRQIATGLHEVHDHNLVHCDIKPGNVMLQRMPNDSYFATLIDFGIARAGGTADSSGAFVGTPQYCAPEQLLHTSPVDRRTDIYALGLVLYCALSGRSPYGQTSRELLQVKASRSIPKLVDFSGRSYSSIRLDSTIQRMTALEPSERFGDVLEVISELERLLEDSQIQANAFVDQQSEAVELDWNHATMRNVIPPKSEDPA